MLHDCATGAGSFLVRPEPNLELAEVLATQQADEGARRLFDAIDDVLPVLEAARADQLTHGAAGWLEFRREIRDDEAAQGDAAADEWPKYARAHFGLLGIVGRDRSAERNSRPEIQMRDHRIRDRASDVVEIDIDAVRAGDLKGCVQIICAFVVDSGIEAEFLLDESAFGWPAGNADNAAARQLG
jgi:hypothetical protein